MQHVILDWVLHRKKCAITDIFGTVNIRVRTTKQYNDINVELPDVNTCPCYMQENTLTVRKYTMKYLGLVGHRVCNLPPNEKQYTWDKMLTEST